VRVTTLTEAHDPRVQQPRSLIVTIYGLYARGHGGSLSVAAIIRLMAELGVDEPAVRSSISRLKRRGVLVPEPVDGAAGYALSDVGRMVLADGDHRIFRRPQGSVDEGWLLAVFSVPESERARRHTLRTRLTWLGFGTAASGVWVAPAHLYDEARDSLTRHGLTGYVDLFRADYLAFSDLRRSVATWWDLEELQRLYDAFLTAYGPVLARWRRRRTADDAQAFADYVRALTQWRRLPYLDPGLPAELLPRDWHGRRAADLFFALQEHLAGAAARHVELVTC
jgi:phenylacetic acid degradation operon negative regulatory protein